METYLVHPNKLQEKALEVPYEVKKETAIPAHVIKGIKKGQEDVEAGRTISLSEFKTRIA